MRCNAVYFSDRTGECVREPYLIAALTDVGAPVAVMLAYICSSPAFQARVSHLSLDASLTMGVVWEVVVLKYVANTRECNRPVGWVAIYAIRYFLAAFGYCIYVSVTGYKSRQSLWTRAGDHLAMLPLWGMYHIATAMALFFPQMRVGTYIFLAQVLHMLDLFRILGLSLSPLGVGSWIFPFPCCSVGFWGGSHRPCSR